MMKRLFAALTSFLAALSFSATVFAVDMKVPGMDKSTVTDTLKSAPKKGVDELNNVGRSVNKGITNFGHEMNTPSTPSVSPDVGGTGVGGMGGTGGAAGGAGGAGGGGGGGK